MYVCYVGMLLSTVASYTNLLVKGNKGDVRFFREEVDLENNNNNGHGHDDQHADHDIDVLQERLSLFSLLLLLLLLHPLLVVHLVIALLAPLPLLYVSVLRISGHDSDVEQQQIVYSFLNMLKL